MKKNKEYTIHDHEHSLLDTLSQADLTRLVSKIGITKGKWGIRVDASDTEMFHYCPQAAAQAWAVSDPYFNTYLVRILTGPVEHKEVQKRMRSTNLNNSNNIFLFPTGTYTGKEITAMYKYTAAAFVSVNKNGDYKRVRALPRKTPQLLPASKVHLLARAAHQATHKARYTKWISREATQRATRHEHACVKLRKQLRELQQPLTYLASLAEEYRLTEYTDDIIDRLIDKACMNKMLTYGSFMLRPQQPAWYGCKK